MYRLSATEIRNNYLRGQVSAEEIARYFLKRIHAHDDPIRSFLHIYNERAIQKAQAIDAKRARGEKLGKLAGIPVALKDNIHVNGELTTCGSRFLENYRAVFDATVTKLIEEEDGIIIGKTNLDEFAMGSSNEYSAFHKTANPWKLTHVPGGSSGGSAASVASRLVPLALGSETGGSVRQPASLCGIFGFKPTYGRVSRYGLVAFGSSLDQISPFATNTEDLALLMEVIGTHCKHDATSIELPSESITSALKTDLKGTKIGVPYHLIDELPGETYEIFHESLRILQSQGAELVDIQLSLLKYSIAVYYILATAEASTNLARFDGIRYGVRAETAQTLHEVYDKSRGEGFGSEVKRRIMLGTYVLSSGYQDAYYRKAQKVRTLMIEEFKKIYQQVQLIAMPVSATPAFEMGSVQDPLNMYLMDLFTIPANLAGLPSISLPAGFTKQGMPMGCQLMGPQMQDKNVIAAAHAFERATTFSKKIPPLFDKE